MIVAISGFMIANFVYLSTLNWNQVADEIEERATKEQLRVMRKSSDHSEPFL